MGQAWTQSLGASLPVIFPGRAEQTAAYRLLSNPGVTIDHILDSHVEQTVERCAAEPLVLAIQDTTTLNYDGLAATSDLDDLGGGWPRRSGSPGACGRGRECRGATARPVQDRCRFPPG